MNASVAPEFQESSTVTLEWTVRNLKQLFEGSKGEQKSKVVKSAVFGGGRWQVLFYPNSGHEGGGYISLYLSCEPTADEKEKAVNGKWQREGLYKFTFELRSVNKTNQFNSKEAYNHAFSWKTANWGWAQFARRDAVYYSPNSVRGADAFVIVCQITDSPAPPTSSVSKQTVPRDLLGSVGSLLDDPCYSDVEFVLPPRRRGGKTRRIYASKKLLAGRAEYFRTMFSSGFAEAAPDMGSTSGGLSSFEDTDYVTVYSNAAEDSDEEDAELDDMAWEVSSDADVTAGKSNDDPGAISDVPGLPAALVPVPGTPAPTVPSISVPPLPGPPKVQVVVRDVAYATYKSFLYYLYTDTIVFAPLKSQFMPSSPPASSFAQAILHLPVSSDGAPMNSPGMGVLRPDSAGGGRRGWVRDWESNNPDRPSPCSAKAIYRLADKLDLGELKSRAFSHISKSTTEQNVLFELFSGFSAAFDDVQMEFALAKWAEIRNGGSMRQITQELRSGRHPGYEEVMPLLLAQLEYKRASSEGSGDEMGREGLLGDR
ncbi:The BTB (BR-C, ttk and bab)/POZ (Pox virus and Zinc finger) domain [Ceratobasidium sp. AG-Ba]|nr:The BTB (BR-C, ttk and bab)/POZ (Pox virus and Zinc finger) domain [Ceratobasidium sp. AG-Ba]QRW07981.1 The BTB (BR-C, ttk and bab)/POZ (Pox virus and Zinc finger) domain [Ceratobasidium sp. AG-Ba]